MQIKIRSTRHVQRVGPRRDAAFKTQADMRDYFRAHTLIAATALLDVLEDEDSSAPAKVSAAREVLDRGWGKPVQSLVFDSPDDAKIINLINTAEEAANTIIDMPLLIEDEEVNEQTGNDFSDLPPANGGSTD